MKIFLVIFVLLCSSSVFGDDISDFQIEGISVGDSLLDYFDEKKIESWEKNYHIGVDNKEFFYVVSDDLNNSLYGNLLFTLKQNDKKYIIYGLRGGKFFLEDFNKCLIEKDKIVTEYSNLFNTDAENYEFIYDYLDDGKSIAYITDFNLQNGSIRIYCVDWSKVTEENKNWGDNLSVTTNTKEYLDWLNQNNK